MSSLPRLREPAAGFSARSARVRISAVGARRLRVLFASSEIYPLAKTGGLADVSAALPVALSRLDVDVRAIMPGYRGVAERLRNAREVGRLSVRGQDFRVLEGTHPDHALRILLVDAPALYAREGTPYADGHGYGHGDNAWRFGCFSEAIARVACGEIGEDLRADVLHLNDWHTALAPVHLAKDATRPRTVFTIHNLAYQGVFGRGEFDALGLPPALWDPRALEFHGEWSFMKAGLLFSDALTTVSPTYAREIQTEAFGERLDGVLRERSHVLRGILNGIDDAIWNPRTDPLIAQQYDVESVREGKAANKRALQRELGLRDAEAPLLAFIGRLAFQKGADALLAARSELDKMPLQIVVLGTGDRELEAGFERWAREATERVAVRATFDEGLAHRIEAAADLFVMPSRYEPCGMNQMYSQRYGAVPLVRRVGGLADSVVDFRDPEGTGIHFEHSDAGGILYAVRTALELFGDADAWSRIQRAGLSRDFSWRRSAMEYRRLYEALMSDRSSISSSAYGS